MKTVNEFVAQKMTFQVVSDEAKVYNFQPGNGSMYELLVLPIRNFDMHGIGSVDTGYLVVEGRTGKAYPFATGGFLMKHYVAEKFSGAFRGDVDIACTTAMLGRIIERETNVEDIKELGI